MPLSYENLKRNGEIRSFDISSVAIHRRRSTAEPPPHNADGIMSLTSSYLDHLDARLEKQGGRGSLSRLLLVARKGEAGDDPDAVVRYHERVSILFVYTYRCV